MMHMTLCMWVLSFHTLMLIYTMVRVRVVFITNHYNPKNVNAGRDAVSPVFDNRVAASGFLSRINFFPSDAQGIIGIDHSCIKNHLPFPH
jgi:hypothetical protein